MGINLTEHIILKAKISYFLTYYQKWLNKFRDCSSVTFNILYSDQSPLIKYSNLIDELISSISAENPQVLAIARLILDRNSRDENIIDEELKRERAEFDKLTDKEKTNYLTRHEEIWTQIAHSINQQAERCSDSINEWNNSDNNETSFDIRFVGLLNQEIINLARQLAEAKQKIVSHEEKLIKLADLQSEIQELKAKISHQTQQIQNLESEKSNYEQEKEIILKRMGELKTQLDKNSVANSQLGELTQEKVNLENQIKDYKARIDSLTIQVTEQKDEISQQNQQLTNLENEYFLCQQKENDLKEKNKNLTKQISDNQNNQATNSWWDWRPIKQFYHQNKAWFNLAGISLVVLLIFYFFYKKSRAILSSN